jgi:hypothetical protein
MMRLVTRPGDFLDERSQNLSLRTPAGFVVLAGIVSSFETLVVNQLLEPAIANELTLAIGLFIVFRLAEQGLMWLLGALVVSAVSKVLHGRITYYRSLHVIGWGFPAIVLASVVQVVGYYLALQNVPQPTVAALENEGITDTSILQAIDNYNEYVASATAEPVWTFVTAGTVACFLLAGYLWMHGAEQYGSGFDRSESAVLAGVVVLVFAWLVI